LPWEEIESQMGESVEVALVWDLAAQPAPDFDDDQRVNSLLGETAIQTHCGLAHAELANGGQSAP
jgi:hypothetical protein